MSRPAIQIKDEDDKLVPFVIGDYIKNPVRIARVDAGLTQQELAKRLDVTEGYISKIEGRNFEVSEALMKRINRAVRHKT